MEVRGIIEGALLEVEFAKINGVCGLRIHSALTSVYTSLIYRYVEGVTPEYTVP